MFAKLVKHEFRATRRVIPFVYLATLILIGSNLLISRLDINWLNGLMIVLLAILGIAMIILTYVVVFFHYYRNLYSHEGYLMHTLPVKPGLLLLSKSLVAFVWIVISYLMTAGVALTIFYMLSDALGAGGTLADFWGQLKAVPYIGWTFTGLGIYICLAALYLMAQVYFAISLGSLSRFQRLGLAAPILFYLGINFVLQFVSLGAMMLIPIGLRIEDSGGFPAFQFVFQSMFSVLKNPNQPIIGLGVVIIMIIVIPGLLAASGNLLKRHTSLK